MRRKKSPGRSVVYEYGCLRPVRGEQEATDQMKLANDLWNALVEIENTYQQKWEELVTPPDVLEQDREMGQHLRDLEQQIRSRRQAARSGTVGVADLERQKRELEAERKQYYRDVLKPARDKLRKERAADIDALELWRRGQVKEAEHASKGLGLHWLNSEDVINRYETARVRVLKDRAEAAKRGADLPRLQFHRWDGTGKVNIRYSTGLPVEKVFGGDGRLQIDPVPDEAWTSPSRSERRRLARTRVRIRVGSDGRQPVWMELPMVMHRPMPPGAQVRSASVKREFVAGQPRYKLLVTVRLPEVPPQPQGTRPACGIDLGWRKLRSVDGKLRAGYVVDEMGNGHEIALPPDTLLLFEQVDRLDSVRDERCNEMLDVLIAWLKQARSQLPEWLQEAAKGVSHWKPRHLVRLLRSWQKQRFPGDEQIVAALESWYKQEQHLYSWQGNLRDQLLRHRREIYRKEAAELAKKYGAVYMEKFDLRQVSRQPKPEEGTKGENKRLNWMRKSAAVSTLRQAIQSACSREGVSVSYVEAKDTTRKCHVCGHVDRFDAAKELRHTCSQCGSTWDQDYNAAIQILRLGLEGMVSPCAGG